jgi:hypothetical protein
VARDLRRARHGSDDRYIHSLEGCVWQGFLPRLASFPWDAPATPPDKVWLAEALRRLLRGTLSASAHPWPVASVGIAGAWSSDEHGGSKPAAREIRQAPRGPSRRASMDEMTVLEPGELTADRHAAVQAILGV